jgi:lipoprotein-releasing system permease protein
MNFELFVARRYLTARRKQAFISVITFISILGITIGVMALVIAIALITGFQSDVQDKILGSTSHIMVSSVSSEGIGNYELLMAEIKTVPGVIQATPVVNDTVLLRGPYKSDGALLRGIDFEMEKESSLWLRELDMGNVPGREDKHEGIVLGRELAIRIGAVVGDGITVLTSPSRLSPVGLMPRMKRFAVTGIF